VSLVGVLSAGCATTTTTTTTTTTVEVVASGNANPTPLAASSAPVLVTWSNLRSTPGCFFFSGPESLGRDDHLGGFATLTTTAMGAELAFDGALVFSGAASGPTISVSRSAPHDFGGTWTSRETIVLSRSGAAWVGTYHYDEHEGAATAPGTCHIDASVVVSAR
jgi:hypothetical protein